MSTYKIFPLHLGLQEPRPKITTYLQNPGELVSNPILSYLIIGNGRIVLVDTGCGDEQWIEKYHNYKIEIPSEMEMLNAIRAVGVEPDKVDFIINTHLHHDHCFNNYKLPGKKIYVQQEEIKYAISPDPCQWVYYETSQVGLTPPWIAVMDRFEIVNGDVTIVDGIELIKFSGHTPGSQGVLVNTTDGKYLIAGDVVSAYENWEGKGIYKHIPVNIHCSVSDCYKDFEKIEKLNVTKVLPGHDIRVLEHSVYPV